MYDASLDQFRKHAWNKPVIWPEFVNALNWNSSQNFAGVQSQPRWFSHDNYRHFEKQYDILSFELTNKIEYERTRRLMKETDLSRGFEGAIGMREVQAAAAPVADANSVPDTAK